MLGAQSKSTIDIKCTEPALPGIPNLLFGKQIDSDVSYFDATSYINKQGLSKNIGDFFETYKTQIDTLCRSYEIESENVCKINLQGHYLIDSNFVYLFLSFVEPNFLAYMCDRMNEIFTQDISISDTYLVQLMKSRLTKEFVNTIFDNDTGNE